MSRDAFAARVLERDDEEDFARRAYLALWKTALRGGFFIVDDVWREMGPDLSTSRDRRAMAGVLARGRRAGMIAPTDEFQASEQRQCHGNLRRIWRSLVWED